MKILVTGGCGFIGSHITDYLQEAGHEVISLDNLSSGKEDRIKVKNIKADITNKEQTTKAIQEFKPEVIIHTAAQVQLRRSLEDPYFDLKTNVEGTINVLEAAKDTVKKFIYTSTGGACYGEPKGLPVPESAPKEPMSPYGISKYTAELYVQQYANLHNFDHLIFRFGNVYGPRDDPATKRVTSVFIDALLNKKPFAIFGDGDQTRDYLFVKDIAKTITQVVDKPTKSNIYNLGSGVGTSVNKVYELIAKELNIQEPATHKEAVKGEVRFIYLDIEKAKEELDWNPTMYEEGIKETVGWFKQNN